MYFVFGITQHFAENTQSIFNRNINKNTDENEIYSQKKNKNYDRINIVAELKHFVNDKKKKNKYKKQIIVCVRIVKVTWTHQYKQFFSFFFSIFDIVCFQIRIF